MRQPSVSIAICCCLLMLLGACKREDRDPPSVALSHPSEGFTVIADSLFRISGHATDDQGLVSITAILFETFTETVVQTKSVPIQGLENDFSFTMPAGDRYTEGGTYTLKVTAHDAAENLGSAFIQLTVQDLPLEYRGVIWAGEGTSNTFSIFARDTSGAQRNGPTGLVDLKGLLADNRNNQVVAVQSLGSVFTGWEAEEFLQTFRLDLAQGTGTETYSGISMNRNAYYTSVMIPSYLRSYRFDGTLKNNFDEVLYPGTSILATNDKLYLGVLGVLGTPMKVDAYDVVSESLLSTQVLDWEATTILPINADQILVCGNANGVGQVLVLDKQSLVRDQILVLQEEFLGAASANGRVWLLLASGLVEFFPANGTISAVLTSGSYSAIGADATRNRIFLGGNNTLEVRTGAGALVEQLTGSYGQVRFIQTRYNK